METAYDLAVLVSSTPLFFPPALSMQIWLMLCAAGFGKGVLGFLQLDFLLLVGRDVRLGTGHVPPPYSLTHHIHQFPLRPPGPTTTPPPPTSPLNRHSPPSDDPAPLPRMGLPPDDHPRPDPALHVVDQVEQSAVSVCGLGGWGVPLGGWGDFEEGCLGRSEV